MPELGWLFGCPYALALMAIVAGGILWSFRRKGWLGYREELPDERTPRSEDD